MAMGAIELMELTDKWPASAWPNGLGLVSCAEVCKWVVGEVEGIVIPAECAAMMFEASGLRYLMRQAGEVYISDHSHEGGVARVTLGDTRLTCSRLLAGNNLLEAISAALAALNRAHP